VKHIGRFYTKDDVLSSAISALLIGIILGAWAVSGVAPAVVP
jgi:hypothetical protein